MNKTSWLFSALVFLSSGLFAQAPPWLWASFGIDQAASYVGDVAVDKSGNIYFTGEFSGALTIGTQTLQSNGGKDIFVAKFTSNGTLIWVKSGGGVWDDDAPGLVIDNNGQVYVAGGFSNQAFFGHLTLTSEGGSDIFLAKYDSDGTLLWLKSFGGSANDMVGAGAARGIFLDNSSHLNLVGSFGTPFDMGGITLQGRGGMDVFIAKLDTNAQVIWATSAGGSHSDYGLDIYVDAMGATYIAGNYDGTMYLDTIKLVSDDFGDMFLAKYDSFGRVLWARTAGGNLPDGASSLVCDGDFNVYVLGEFNSMNLNFGSKVIKNKGDFDVFLAKYDSSGRLDWAKSIGGPGGDYSYDITCRDEQIYILGSFTHRMNFDSDTLWSHQGNGGEDGFVAKYTTNGVFQWAKNAGGSGGDRLFGIDIDPSGYPIVTGRINSTSATFGNSTVVGPNAPFIAKLGLFPESVKDVTMSEIQVYPNPTTGMLQINLGFGINIDQASIRDMQGRLIREYADMDRGRLDVSDLPSGVYMLYLDTDQGRMQHRFVKAGVEE